MSTWTDISNPSVAVGGIPSSATVTALRDNPVAIAGAASGAPVVFAGWHPYNKVTVGDSADGLIYDAAVNGVVADVVTPDFEDGYEYRLTAADLSHNNGGNNRQLALQLYFETLANYVAAYTTPSSGDTTDEFGMEAEILLPRVARENHLVRVMASIDNSIESLSNGVARASFGSSQKVLKVRLIFSVGSVNRGKVWLHRRREYISSP